VHKHRSQAEEEQDLSCQCQEKALNTRGSNLTTRVADGPLKTVTLAPVAKKLGHALRQYSFLSVRGMNTLSVSILR
jgi:hypothetical protein